MKSCLEWLDLKSNNFFIIRMFELNLTFFFYLNLFEEFSSIGQLYGKEKKKDRIKLT